MGGPSDTQKAAAGQTLQNSQNEGKLADQSTQKFNSLYAGVDPFYANEQQNGLPFMNSLNDYASGTTARAYAPVKGQFLRNQASMGALPSGSKAAGMNDINESQAQAFDNQLRNNLFANYQAKQAGAAGRTGLMQVVNPASFYGGSSSAGQAAMQPLQPQQNPWMGVLGGVAQGAASAIPF